MLSDAAGHRWPVPRAEFLANYEAVVPTSAGGPGTYRKRAVTVMALCVRQPFCVIMADGTSILHGQPGDWLIDYGNGSLGVVGKDVFDETYDITSDCVRCAPRE
jgi:PGDYG protein